METLIRRRILRHLIWVYTVCQLPFYGSPDYNGLTFTNLSKFNRQIDDIFFYFSQIIVFDISCKLSLQETICMKYQSLFSVENKKTISKCHLLQFFPSMLSFKHCHLHSQYWYYPKYWNILTIKAPRKPASENVVCLCRLLHLLANFSNILFAYRQTVWTQIRLLIKEQSDLGPHCLQK